MNVVRKRAFDQRSILHFISCQYVDVNCDSNSLAKRSQVLWIENVECLKPKANYDISRCLDERSPHSSKITEIINNRTENSYAITSEISPSKMFFNGRISIIKNSEAAETLSERFKLRFCIHETESNLKLSAILHNDGLRCQDLGHMLGIEKYTESQLTSDFNGISGISWRLDVPCDAVVPVIKIQTAEKPIVDSGIYETYDKIKDNLEIVPLDKIKDIASITQDQAQNSDWKSIRAKRLTASLFGVVLKAINNGRFPPSLFNTLLNKYDLSGVPSIQWGVKHEETAKEAYEAISGTKVLSSGFWLHSSGIMGASPDGLLPDGQGIVEFKCPYSIRDISVKEAIETKSNFYLKKNDDGEVYLDKDHAYYHQIQGMMYIIGREYCDFCVWTPVDGPYTIRINKDPAWESCLIKLINFYFKQFLPHIMGNGDEKCLYAGYKELVSDIDNVLQDNKQKRIERKNNRKIANQQGEPPSTVESPQNDNQLPMIGWDDILKLSALSSSPFDQYHSKLWYAIREHRLTSSSFHLVLAAIKRDSFPPSLFKSIMDEYYMRNTSAAKFTHANRCSAIDLYEQQRHTTVLPSGIWLDKSGILGASVTGILEDGKGILDVRCLYKYRTISDIKLILQLKDPLFHLEYNNEGVATLKKSHRLYTQIQGGLYLSQRKYCDIVTWTPQSHLVCRVYKDPDWEGNLEVLREFHSQRLFPKLCEKWGYDNVIKDLMRFRK